MHYKVLADRGRYLKKMKRCRTMCKVVEELYMEEKHDMPQTMQNLIEQYVSEVKKIYGSHLKQIILYGS